MFFQKRSFIESRPMKKTVLEQPARSKPQAIQKADPESALSEKKRRELEIAWRYLLW